MNQVVEISKRAFLARVNQARQNPIVDCVYRIIDGQQRLILIHANGKEKVFEGLKAA